MAEVVLDGNQMEEMVLVVEQEVVINFILMEELEEINTLTVLLEAMVEVVVLMPVPAVVVGILVAVVVAGVIVEMVEAADL